MSEKLIKESATVKSDEVALENPQINVEEGTDLNRRDFFRNAFRGGVAAAAVAGLGGVHESAEANNLQAKLEFVGYSPSEHEKKIIMLKILKVIPSAVSVEVHFNDRSGEVEKLSGVDISVITSKDEIYKGDASGYYQKGMKIQEIVDRALADIKLER